MSLKIGNTKIDNIKYGEAIDKYELNNNNFDYIDTNFSHNDFGNFAIEALVNSTAFSNTNNSIAGARDGDQLFMFFNVFGLEDNGNFSFVSIPNFSQYDDGQYHHCVFTVYEGFMYAYIDNKIVGTEPYIGNVNTVPDIYLFASNDVESNSITRQASGKIKRYRFYSKGLTPAEVNTLYNGGKITQNLEQEFLFTDGSGTVINDTSGNNRNGTIQGGDWQFINAEQEKVKKIIKGQNLIFPNPQIVQNGLVLHLDAANQNSYSGSGSTWFDISGNNNNANILGANFVNDFGGALNFDGSNDYLNFSNDSNFNFIDFTLSIWIKFEGVDMVNNGNRYGLFSKTDTTGGNPNGYQLVLRDLGVNAGGILLRVGDGSSMVSPEGDQVSRIFLDGNYHNVVAVYKNNDFLFYVLDGVVLTYTNINSFSHSSNNQFYIGRWDNGDYFNGKISQATVYNRALTLNEISQNYNSVKIRYL